MSGLQEDVTFQLLSRGACRYVIPYLELTKRGMAEPIFFRKIPKNGGLLIASDKTLRPTALEMIRDEGSKFIDLENLKYFFMYIVLNWDLMSEKTKGSLTPYILYNF